MNLLPKLPLPKFFSASQNDNQQQSDFTHSLLQYEAETGGQLFGPVAKGHHRQFFCLDEYTWVWYEEWKDRDGKQQSVTTRYEVRPNGILKAQDGQGYQRLSRDETRNLCRAASLYQQRIGAEYRRMLQTA
jgi:hypothetical protein